MEYMGKKLEDIIIVLPFADGTSLECGVYAYFEIDKREYFALLPRKEDKTLDFTQSYMLYRIEKDAKNNPVVEYIADDAEYAVAAKYFADNYMNK